MIKASYSRTEADGSARCSLCPHGCLVPSGQTGLCGARGNANGTLYALTYGRVAALALDPVEKKPLRRFRPGSAILSVGSVGCNLTCAFCQNHELSGHAAPCRELTPGQIAAQSQRLAPEGNIGVAYTYNEPLVGFEFVRDTCKLIREQSQKNVLVTNGYVNPGPLAELLPLIDAMNIDLKAFTEDGYRALGGTLSPVLATIEAASRACHVEVTTLVVPGLNDDPAEIDAMCEWLARVSPDIPLHLSRFFPRHLMTGHPPTPAQTIERMCGIARRHLRYVYPGNI